MKLVKERLRFACESLVGCDCEPGGSMPEICDKESGSCICKGNFRGQRCNRCGVGFHRFPHCVGTCLISIGFLMRK